MKLYGVNGGESLTATCKPLSPADARKDRVNCDFVQVRFSPPAVERENRLTGIVKGLKARMREEGKDAKAVDAEIESARTEFCSEYRDVSEKLSTQWGAKQKLHAQQVLAACAAPNPLLVFERFDSLEARTCELYVGRFDLDFTKVKSGQWLFRQEEPGRIIKVLKVYELTGTEYDWTLVETRVPTDGTNEQPSRTAWKTKFPEEYELPCEFINHQYVQAP